MNKQLDITLYRVFPLWGFIIPMVSVNELPQYIRSVPGFINIKYENVILQVFKPYRNHWMKRSDLYKIADLVISCNRRIKDDATCLEEIEKVLSKSLSQS